MECSQSWNPLVGSLTLHPLPLQKELWRVRTPSVPSGRAGGAVGRTLHQRGQPRVGWSEHLNTHLLQQDKV